VDDDFLGCSWTSKHLHQLRERYAGEVERSVDAAHLPLPSGALRATCLLSSDCSWPSVWLLSSLNLVNAFHLPDLAKSMAAELRARPTWGLDCSKAGLLGAQPSLRQPLQQHAGYVTVCVAQLH
jgi:hypothetical protein